MYDFPLYLSTLCSWEKVGFAWSSNSPLHHVLLYRVWHVFYLSPMYTWVINSGFHRFLRLCGCNGLPHGRSCCFLNGSFQQFLSTCNPCNWNLLKLKFLTLIFEIQIGVLPHFSLVIRPYGCWEKFGAYYLCPKILLIFPKLY